MSRWYRVLTFGGFAPRRRTYLSTCFLMALGASASGQGNTQAITPVDASSIPRPTPPLTPEPQTNPQTAPANPVSPQTQAATAPTTNPTSAQDGPVYRVSNLLVGYKFPHPALPTEEQLLSTEVRLSIIDDAYVAARPGLQTVTIRIGDIGKQGPQKMHRTAINAVCLSLVRLFNSMSIRGSFVVVDAADVDETEADVRPADRTSLQLVVVIGTVKEVRTVDLSEGADARINNPQQKFIRDKSPIKPATTESPTRNDLWRSDLLDDYIFQLNRFPGRRVAVGMSATNELGGMTLDYLVSETRPWYVYSQVSNTGTKQTNEWRERFGYGNYQLTGHDDNFSIDYVTAGFEASHAIISSYELPFFDVTGMRYKVYASWNQYTASDVGQANEQFTGEQWTVGNEIISNIFQKRELFVDVVGGIKVEGITTENKSAQTDGAANYWIPYFGFRLERLTDISATNGSLMLEWYHTRANDAEITSLGRTNPSHNPIVLTYDFGQSFFLEPLLWPRQFAAGKSTLAHEIFISTHGQYAFNARLFPNAQEIAGGMFSVRGYPESVVAGDSVFIGTVEYRFHVPRVFAVQAEPSTTPFLWDRNFRYAPQQQYGKPDWDLMLRAFVDAGQVLNSSRQSFERDATLLGVGVGVELQYRQNFNIRVDWGVGLTDVHGEGNSLEAHSGDNRFHILTQILY